MRPDLSLALATALLSPSLLIGCSDGGTDPDPIASGVDSTSAPEPGTAPGPLPVTDDEPVAGGGPDPAPDDDPVAGDDFRASLVGARDYGCTPGDESSFSTRYVELWTEDGRYVWDLHLHEDTGCADRPLSFASQLSIETWTLAGPLVAADGREAFGIDFETVQERIERGESVHYDLGTAVYDIAALEEGGVTLGTELALSAEERGDTLFDPSPAVPYTSLSGPMSREALQGTFAARCFRSREQTRAFEGAIFTETVAYFVDDACTERHATRTTRWDIEYGEAATTAFGDAVLETRMTAGDSTVDVETVDGDAPEPPEPTERGRTFFDIWAVVGDELVVGTCLDKRPGDAADGCGTSEALRADVLNLNIGNRYVRR